MNFSNVAIIGSNGFIGTHLTKKLQELPGIKINLFGRAEESVFGNDLPYCKVDLANKEQVTTLFAGMDLVYYLASMSIPSTTWENPVMEIEQNLLPFLNFMECAAKVGVKKVVFISSAGTIYGATHLKVNEQSYTNPFSPYGITKLTMEHFLNYFRVKNNLDFDIYRVSNIYGEGQDPKKGVGIINTFLESIIKNNKINIFGNGEHVRNYIYIDDLANLLSLSLNSGPGVSNVFNAASNDTLNINDLVAIIKEVVTEDFEVIYTPSRQSDNPAIYLDNEKILTIYPDFRLTTVKEGIAKTYAHLKATLS